MRSNTATPWTMTASVLLAVLLAACGTNRSGETSTTQSSTTTGSVPAESSTTTQPEQTGYAVYLMVEDLGSDTGGPFLVPVYREGPTGGDEAGTVLDLLLAGPTQAETEGTPAISTAIPEGTSRLGVSVESGVATVDLSGEYDDGGGSFGMFARLAQVVYTLTRLDGVEAVTFQLEGTPVTVFSSEGIGLDGPQRRDGYYQQLPAIFVDSPAWGEPVTSPFLVSGLSNVFEATSQVMLTDDDGLPLFEATVTATCGTGCWGEWGIDVPYTVDREQLGSLIVWEYSAKDGSRVNIREYPILLR